MEPPPSRQRAATAWTGGGAALHAKAALQLAEKRQYRDLLHAIQLRPELAQQRDDFGMTPLHWLCTDRAVPLRVLQQVVLAFPEAATVRNLAGLLPLHMAVRKDLPLDALKTVLKFFPKAVVAETPDGKAATEIADDFVTSRSAKVFLSMLEQEVRSLSRVPAASQSSLASKTTTTSSSDDHRNDKHEVIRGWDNGYPVSIGESGSGSSSSQRTLHDPALDGISTRPLPPVWKLGKSCHVCDIKFGYFKNRHHCRNCGESVCGRHSKHSVPLKHLGLFHPQRVCSGCYGRLQSHYTSRAIARMNPHNAAADRVRPDAVFEDMLPSHSPPRHRQLRSRSVLDMSAHSVSQHHPLLSPRHYQSPLTPSPTPSSVATPPPPTRMLRSATLSPRTCRTASSSNTIRSGVSAATTTSSAYQPNFIKAQSGFSMHFTQVQRTDEQRTVLERQREMQRRRDRLAHTDIETYEPRSPRGAWSDRQDSETSGSFNNQSSNDDHEIQLEMQMQKLLVAKKQISDALKQSKRQAEVAQAQKEKYDKMADDFEQRGYSPASSMNDMEYGVSSTMDDSESELDDMSSFASSNLGKHSLVVSEDNQHDHELDGCSSPMETTSYHQSDSGEDEDCPVYAMVPETTPGEQVRVDSMYSEQESFDVPLDRAATWHDLGVALLTKGDFVGAIAELKKSLDLDATNALAWYHYAKALDGKGDASAAETAIHRSVSLEPDSLPSLSLLGKLLNARGEHDEAIVVFRRALNLQCPNERESVEACG